MCIGIKGTAPGVEQGKELSLSVEERSSPESCEARVDADGPQPVTYIQEITVFWVTITDNVYKLHGANTYHSELLATLSKIFSHQDKRIIKQA